MKIGSKVTWRRAVKREVKGNRYVAGERVLTGTILNFKKSQTGAVFVEIRIEDVTGYRSNDVSGQIWMKRSKLKKGMTWQKSVMRELEQKQQRKRLPKRYRSTRRIKGQQNSKHGPARCFSPDEIADWATKNGYGVSSSVTARVTVP